MPQSLVVCRGLFWLNGFRPSVNPPGEAPVRGVGIDNFLPGFLFWPKTISHEQTSVKDLPFHISPYLLFCFLISFFRQDREMLIRFNEIDIYINRSENTKGEYLSHFKSHVASHLKRNSSQSLLESPPPPTASSLHWLLLYVIEIETSIKLSLLLGTKESDILEWRILLWFKPLYLITPILHLY